MSVSYECTTSTDFIQVALDIDVFWLPVFMLVCTNVLYVNMYVCNVCVHVYMCLCVCVCMYSAQVRIAASYVCMCMYKGFLAGSEGAVGMCLRGSSLRARDVYVIGVKLLCTIYKSLEEGCCALYQQHSWQCNKIALFATVVKTVTVTKIGSLQLPSGCKLVCCGGSNSCNAIQAL